MCEHVYVYVCLHACVCVCVCVCCLCDIEKLEESLGTRLRLPYICGYKYCLEWLFNPW